MREVSEASTLALLLSHCPGEVKVKGREGCLEEGS